MMIAVILMCAGSLMVALLPTYASIGVAAPVLLLIARLLQGLSVGGEYGTSATYMSEVALHRHRGFFASRRGCCRFERFVAPRERTRPSKFFTPAGPQGNGPESRH